MSQLNIKGLILKLKEEIEWGFMVEFMEKR